MTKKVKVSFMILVWSIVGIQIYVNYQEAEKHHSKIQTAFSVAEGGVERDAMSVGGGMERDIVSAEKPRGTEVDTLITEEVISSYGYLGKMDLSDETKEKMLVNLAQKFGISDGYTIMNGKGSGFEKKMLIKEGKYADTTLQIISMKAEAETEQYIVSEIKAKDEVEKAVSLYQKVKRVYEEIGIDGKSSLEIAMEKGGSPAAQADLVAEVLDLTDAKKVDEIAENGITTIYGYTKLEDSYLNLNGKKVNIQVVLSYNEETNQTYIKIGVPIVNSSY